MTLRLVQSGRGERRDVVVVYYLTTELDRAVRDAVGDSAIIINDTRPQDCTSQYRYVGEGGVMPLDATVAWAQQRAGALATGRVIVCGYSAGCQAVRSLLLHAGGRRPDAVVTIDGTHASDPPADWQIDVWRELAAEARTLLSRRIWIATHTAIVPPSYLSTTRVLELATGWELPEADARRFESELQVWSSRGRDAAAHRDQARRVLPEALRMALGRLDGRRWAAEQMAAHAGARYPQDVATADTDPAPAPPPADVVRGDESGAVSLEPGPLGRAVLATALGCLAARIAEVPPGSDRGPVVSAWLRAVGAAPPASWCAAGVSAWLRGGAAVAEVPCPVAGSAGARALGAQFRAAGRWAWAPQSRASWHDGERLIPALHLLPGQVLVWARGDLADPLEWRGHVGVLQRWDGVALRTIEANSGPRGDRVAAMQRELGDPRLLGVGLVTTPEEAMGRAAILSPPSQLALDEAGRLMALGADVMRDGEPSDPLARIG